MGRPWGEDLRYERIISCVDEHQAANTARCQHKSHQSKDWADILYNECIDDTGRKIGYIC